MGFLFLIILLLFILWFLRPMFRIYRSYKQMRNAFNSAAGQNENGQRRSRSQWFGNRRKKEQRRKKNEKIIPREYAEDVEFTEVKDRNADNSLHSAADTAKQYRETQITDAEWEEIK